MSHDVRPGPERNRITYRGGDPEADITRTEVLLRDAMLGRVGLDETRRSGGMTRYRGLSGPDLVRPFEEDPAWQ